MLAAPFLPIIYIRGYAMTATERDETTADPFCGFNTGSTVYRASVQRNDPARKLIFESPVLRLISDFDYQEVYENGSDIVDAEWQPRKGRRGIPARSVVIYRYYESGSTLLGDGQPRPIEDYARGLSHLIARVRELVVAEEGCAPEDFRCYLVAHSMGGLVARGMLQNPAHDPQKVRKTVAKFFTYGTPHNGIDVAGVNVPEWLSLNEIRTFNRERIARLTGMEAVLKKYGRVDFIPAQALPIDQVFCMVGTNRADYDVAAGLSRTFVGHGSDGLVKIENASLWGLDAAGEVSQPAATAFAYRAHSGHYGIVNSEEAYQNLSRFLFGDVRVDLWLQIDAVRLPAAIAHQPVEALYQFEVSARPKGKPWLLTRRLAEEDSPACRTHQQLTDPAQPAAARLVYLSTVFLANVSRVNQQDPTLSYAMDVGIRVPDYVVQRRLWLDGHFEGAYLFRDILVVHLTPATTPGGAWQVTYGWQSQGLNTSQPVAYKDMGQGRLEIQVPFDNPGEPGVSGKVLLSAVAWNHSSAAP